MKLSAIVLTGLVLVGTASLVLANPALLPKHPGYPSSGNANDAGQVSLTQEQSLRASAVSEDVHTGQMLVDPNNGRKLKSNGAGQLPVVQGPQIAITPPVAEATRMPKN